MTIALLEMTMTPLPEMTIAPLEMTISPLNVTKCKEAILLGQPLFSLVFYLN